MDQTRILVVDDEADIIDLAAMYLESEGFVVERASDGREALRAITENPPDLVVLDIMLPEIDGWEVCRRIRNAGDLPVIMLTARGDAVDRVVGLELGADDYVVKPFHGRELVARVKTVLRRAGNQSASTAESADEARIEIGDIQIDPPRRTTHVAGTLVDMRAREFDLLRYFARNRGIVMSRDTLLDKVWGYEFLGDSRTVDVHVAHVRNHIKGSQTVNIETVWGVGYKLTIADA